MGFADVRQTVENYIATNWTATPIQFENVPFDIPESGEWIRVNILPGTGFAETLGTSGYNMYTGLIYIAVFAPENTGTAQMLVYSDALMDLFNRKTINEINFGAPSLRSAMSPFSGYNHKIVEIPFWFIAN